MNNLTKYDLIKQLQKEVISMQGYKKGSISQTKIGAGQLEDAFPDRIFPLGAVHEFISNAQEDAAATNGFITALLSRFIQQEGICLWVSAKCTVFPPALKLFGIEPERIIFIDLKRQKDVLWAVEEALKCESLAAVIGELTDLSFTESRRLQLAVEQSHVTGFIHRYNPRSENIVACVTRWKIKALPSFFSDDMPGVGFSRWNVQLLKVRNGKPDAWQIEWNAGDFRYISKQTFTISKNTKRKTG
jgi:protein ImuA